MKTTKITIETNGDKKVIDLTNINSLSITYENDNIDIKYTEEIKETILTTRIRKSKPATKPKQPAKKSKKDNKQLESIDEKTLVQAYMEYREAVAKKQGRKLAEFWANKIGVNKSTLTVWLSQINQILEKRPTPNVPKKLFKIAEKI